MLRKKLVAGFFVTMFASSLCAQYAVTDPAAPLPAAVAQKRLNDALKNAKTVDVVFLGNEDNVGNKGYKTFYAKLLAWGRYRVVPSTMGADLIMEYANEDIYVCDGRTLATLEFVPTEETPDFLDQWRAAVGDPDSSTAASNRAASPAAPPKQTKGAGFSAIFHSPKQLTALLQQKNALIATDYFSADFSFNPDDLSARFRTGMAAWGQFQEVPTIGEAGVIFQVSYIETPPAGRHSARPGEYDMTVTVNVLDPKTLAVWGGVGANYPSPASPNRREPEQLAEELIAKLETEVQKAVGSR